MKDWNSAKVTTLVDNDVWKRGLSSSWGLSLYVEINREKEQHAIMMDTSGSFDALSNNAARLRLALSNIEAVFISHWHGDHWGSLSNVLPLLKHSTPVYVPSEDSFGIRKIKKAGGTPMVCSDPVELMEGVMSTGEIGGWVSEHSLVVNLKKKGLVILIGCAHPGVVDIVRCAQRISRISKVFAVMGGFHISSQHKGINVGKFLHKTGVKLVSPCHCTGPNAKTAIANAMREAYVENGAGKVILMNCWL